MPVDKTETVGSRAKTYDSSLGEIETRLFICDLDDVDALMLEFVHNTFYAEMGGCFNRYRSSAQCGPSYATVSLVFTQNPDITLTGGSGAVHADGDAEYNFTTSTMEKPLEAHPDYKACWNYELWAIDGTTTSPVWWPTATSIEIESAEDRGKYQWVKPGANISGWDRLFEVYKEDIPSTVNFRGVESWLYPAPVLHEVKYYRDRNDAYGQLVAVGKLAAPPVVGPYDSEAKKWLITNSTVYRSGRYWVCQTDYSYADIGWNTELYKYAQEEA